MEVASASSTVAGGAVLRTTGPVDWRLGGINLDGTWENSGAITLSNGSTGVTILSGAGTLKNTGTITKSGAGPFLGSANIENSGTIKVSVGRFGSDVPSGSSAR